MSSKAVGVIWLTPSNYNRAVALSEDGMPATYEAWREKIDRLISQLPADISAIRVVADPDEVAAWCKANGRKVDTQGRSSFAAWYLAKDLKE